MSEPKEGDLQVWWIPQVPGHPFYVPVKTPEEAVLIYETLAEYDKFQFKNKIKPDYCNAGGLAVWETDPESPTGFSWCEWYDEEGDDIQHLRIKLHA